MCGLLCAVVMLTGMGFLQGVQAASHSIPIWAYGTDPAAARPAIKAVPDHGLKHLPGGKLSFTEAQIQDPFGRFRSSASHRRATTVRSCSSLRSAISSGVISSMCYVNGSSQRGRRIYYVISATDRRELSSASAMDGHIVAGMIALLLIGWILRV